MSANESNRFEESDEEDFNPPPDQTSDDERMDEDEPDEGHGRRERSNSSPPPAADDDGDDDDDGSPPRSNGRDRRDVTENKGDEEELDDEEEDAGRGRKRRQHDEVEDEEEEEEEEEDEDDEDVSQGHRRKRRRERRNAFLDLEAEVDDEDEAEDDEREGEEIGDFIDNDVHPDDLVEASVDDDLRHRELDARRELDAHMDAEEQAELLKKKYGHRRRERTGAKSIVPRRMLLPSVNDPGIWAVKCREGKEREVVFAIMKRVMERAGTSNEMKILSAFERGGVDSVMRGYVYVEARRSSDILASLDGLLNVYPHTKMILVDIKERPELFRIAKDPDLEPGAWVRLKRPPKHKDDLAQVLGVSESGLEARVRFIPRIDYAPRDRGGDKRGGKGRGGGFGFGKPFVRPPQKLFNPAEARKYNYSDANELFENGFQIKEYKLQHLNAKDVNPTLEEVSRFTSGAEDGTENLDLRTLASSLKRSNASVAYLPGDVVEVYSGEQKGIIGRTTNVQGDIVSITVVEGDLEGHSIDVPVAGLRKRFRIGEHVKVIGGSRFRGETGMVVKVDEDRVTLLNDQMNGEVTVFSKDLREASESGGQNSLGMFSLFDLVELDRVTVGCIVKVERETLVVLNQHGDTVQVAPSQIPNLLPKRRFVVAADRDGSELRVDDVVREHGGMQRQGKVIHIHRAYVFLHTTGSTENAGVFVTKAGSVSTVSAKGGRITTAGNPSLGPDLSAMNPALRRTNAGGDAKMMPPPPKTFGRDKALRQFVVIRKGPYKGMYGIVIDTTATHARVELQARSKIVSVPKDFLTFKDATTGVEIDINRGNRPVVGGQRGGTTSGFGWNGASRTPMAPAPPAATGRTPAWGARTPSADSGRTPAWRSNVHDSRAAAVANGGRTPAWLADGSRTVNPREGNRTAYGGGARTPAWNSGSRTPAPDVFGLGSKTPAWGGSGNDTWVAGAKTPAYGAYVSAPTPGAIGDSWGYTPGATEDAPTPGPDALGAPTPGALNDHTPAALNAPTPGGAYAAHTPAALGAPTPGAGYGGWGADSAPTPGAGYYSAPTPGAFGVPETPGASGPRYADDDEDDE